MLITDSQQLAKICAQIEGEKCISIDTEFMRNRTYYPVPCLLQVCYSGGAFAVDLIDKIDLEPIAKILKNKKIKKIFHSCGQDLEVLKITFGRLPQNIFDTQIAALFLGFDAPPSYNALVEKYLGLRVDKKMQYSNWEARPLSKEQINYAVDDVIHLLQIYKIMGNELAKKKYQTWVDEEFKKVENLANVQTTPEESIKKFLHILKDVETLARCYSLLKWREERAILKNVPKGIVMTETTLIRVLLGKNKKSLPSAVDEILRQPPSKKSIDVVKKFTSRSKGRLKIDVTLQKKLKSLLDYTSREYGISAPYIANSATLQSLASNKKRGLKINSGWRKKIFGRLAQNLIKGDIIITEEHDKLVLKRTNEQSPKLDK